jgi:FkbM family methyltransferase
MNSRLLQVASHQIGSVRFRNHAIPGQGRAADAIGKLAGWISGGCGLASPLPGVQFETDMEDRIQRQMWAVLYEPHVRECFRALLKPGDVYIDVGAHIGFHTVFASHRVGEEGRIFAFEADPVNFKRLRRNLLQFPSAQAINAAVWDQTGSLTFHRSCTKSESGWGSVGAVRDFQAGEHVEIPSLALDEWFRDTKLERWDAMKLDAEGSELAVLRGAESSVGKFRPSIVIEVNTVVLESGGVSPSEVAQFLLVHDYDLFRLEYRRLTSWVHTTKVEFCDVLCIPRERTHEILDRLAIEGFDRVIESS